MEQWETLCRQNGVLQKGWEDSTTQEHTLLLEDPPSLWAELQEEDHVGVSDGHLGRRKTVCHLCRRLCLIGMGHAVERCCKLYHVCVAEKESAWWTRAALRWYHFGAPWKRIAVNVAGILLPPDSYWTATWGTATTEVA